MPDLFQVALKDLPNDTFPLIKQVLNVFVNNIIMDNDLSRTTNISFFNTNFLVNQLKLYTRTEAVPNSDQTVAQLVHEFMMALCTKPGVGICFQDAAWYPPSTLTATTTVEKASSENNKHIFNKTLSQLLTHLRPTENIMQQQLTVSILTACPELVRLYVLFKSTPNITFVFVDIKSKLVSFLTTTFAIIGTGRRLTCRWSHGCQQGG